MLGLLLSLLVLLAPACQGQPAAPMPPPPAPSAAALADTTFARLVTDLSEPGGYFDTDNLISNEASYLHVMGPLRERGLAGGAYLGVGPDQNFSYMAAVRPQIAFLVDIRRDNLLQHLLFKALFTRAPNRITYLALLFGKPVPAEAAAWTDRPLADLVAHLDGTPTTPDDAAVARRQVAAVLDTLPLALSEADRATIAAIHDRFIDAGLGLRFTSHGRPPMPYYPTYRQLLLEQDLDGEPASYLVREADYQFLRQMQIDHRVIPVVGDLAGPHALAAIAHYLTAQDLAVTAFYTSNVEYYLMRSRTFDAFVANVQRLPRSPGGVVIRSYFNRYRRTLPQTQRGYASTQLLHPLDRLVAAYETGAIRSYGDLIRDAALPAE